MRAAFETWPRFFFNALVSQHSDERKLTAAEM
jgi:hypothetical protein